MGSEYEVDLETARHIRRALKTFIKNHPPGTQISTFVMGEPVETEVTKNSRCPEDEALPCEVELRHKKYGGYANYSVNLREKTGEVVISGADFPYPAEFVIAQKELGIPVAEDRDWCLFEFGETSTRPTYCSKRRW